MAAQTLPVAPESVGNRSLAVALELYAKRTRGAQWKAELLGGQALVAMGGYFAFASPAVIVQNHTLVESIISELEDSDRTSLLALSRWSWAWRRPMRPMPVTSLEKLRGSSPDFIRLLDVRLTEDNLLRIIGLATPSVRRVPYVRSLERRAKAAVDLEAITSWRGALPLIRRAYSNGEEVRPHGSRVSRRRLNIEQAEVVVQGADQYPLWLVEQSEAVLRTAVAAGSEPVGEVARRDCWFPDLC